MSAGNTCSACNIFQFANKLVVTTSTCVLVSQRSPAKPPRCQCRASPTQKVTQSGFLGTPWSHQLRCQAASSQQRPFPRRQQPIRPATAASSIPGPATPLPAITAAQGLMLREGDGDNVASPWVRVAVPGPPGYDNSPAVEPLPSPFNPCNDPVQRHLHQPS